MDRNIALQMIAAAEKTFKDEGYIQIQKYNMSDGNYCYLGAIFHGMGMSDDDLIRLANVDCMKRLFGGAVHDYIDIVVDIWHWNDDMGLHWEVISERILDKYK